MNFGDKLRVLIEEHGITQKELATQLNIAPSTLSSYVQNTREPDFEMLKLLANYFNVSADYLLNIQTGKTATYQEDEILRIFRSLTEGQKEIYTEQGQVFVRINAQGQKLSESELKKLKDKK